MKVRFFVRLLYQTLPILERMRHQKLMRMSKMFEVLFAVVVEIPRPWLRTWCKDIRSVVSRESEKTYVDIHMFYHVFATRDLLF